MKNLFFIFIITTILSFSGCVNIFNNDTFDDEEYVWENWIHTTNTVEEIIIK